MKIKNLAIIGFLAFLMLFAGCGASTSSIPGVGGSSGTSKSSGAVDLTFLETPSEVYENQDFRIALQLENYQHHDISGLKLKITGFDTALLTGLDSYSGDSYHQIPTIKKGNDLASNKFFHEIDNLKVANINGNIRFNPMFRYCYNAKTTYSKTICVPAKNKETCTQNNPTANRKLNGPVDFKIESIKSTSEGVYLTVALSNIKSGKVVDSCFPTNDHYKKNFQNLQVKLGTQTASCQIQTSNTFSLDSNHKAKLLCKVGRNQDDEYSTQVTASFNYIYQQEEKMSFLAKKEIE